MRVILTVGVVVTLTLAGTAAGAGLSVSPPELSLEGSEIISHLTVGNPTTGVLLVEVYPDSFDEKIKVEPSSFVLASNQEQITQVIVEPAVGEVIKTNLSVVSQPLAEAERTLGAATGVKIPLEAIKADSQDHSRLAALIGALVNHRLATGVWLGLVSGLVLTLFMIKRSNKRPAGN